MAGQSCQCPRSRCCASLHLTRMQQLMQLTLTCSRIQHLLGQLGCRSNHPGPVPAEAAPCRPTQPARGAAQQWPSFKSRVAGLTPFTASLALSAAPATAALALAIMPPPGWVVSGQGGWSGHLMHHLQRSQPRRQASWWGSRVGLQVQGRLVCASQVGAASPSPETASRPGPMSACACSASAGRGELRGTASAHTPRPHDGVAPQTAAPAGVPRPAPSAECLSARSSRRLPLATVSPLPPFCNPNPNPNPGSSVPWQKPTVLRLLWEIGGGLLHHLLGALILPYQTWGSGAAQDQLGCADGADRRRRTLGNGLLCWVAGRWRGTPGRIPDAGSHGSLGGGEPTRLADHRIAAHGGAGLLAAAVRARGGGSGGGGLFLQQGLAAAWLPAPLCSVSGRARAALQQRWHAAAPRLVPENSVGLGAPGMGGGAGGQRRTVRWSSSSLGANSDDTRRAGQLPCSRCQRCAHAAAFPSGDLPSGNVG